MLRRPNPGGSTVRASMKLTEGQWGRALASAEALIGQALPPHLQTETV